MIVALAALILKPTLLDYSIEQWRSRPQMRAEDAYKWLFHATMGGEHAISDESGPRAWMDGEWKTLTAPLPEEAEIEELTPDGSVIRVNMRPFRARGGDKSILLKAFIDSAHEFKADKTGFTSAWGALGIRLSKAPIMKISRADWTRVDTEMKAHGYPAIDHSEVYEKTYRPAYRVVTKKIWTADAK